MGLNPVQIVTSAVGSLLGLTARLEDIRTGFNFGYVFELLDTSKGPSIKNASVLDTHVLVLNPSSYTLTEPFTATLTPAEDNSVIREENGIIIRQIVLEGTMGVSRKRVSGFEGKQAAGAVSGHAHFLHLRNLFRLYSDLKQSRAPSSMNPLAPRNPKPANTVMVFHSLREDDHFIVVPKSFETPRNKQTRTHYKYRIVLDVVGKTDRDFKEDHGIFGVFDDAVRDVSSAINDARSFFADLDDALEEVRDRIRNIDQLAYETALAINAVTRFARRTQEFIPMPVSAMENVVEQLEIAAMRLDDTISGPPPTDREREIARTVQRLSLSLNETLMHPELFGPPPNQQIVQRYEGETALTEDDLENRTAGATVGSRSRIQGGSADQAGLDLAAGNSTQAVVVNRGDTIDSLADRFQVTPEAIVLANNLRAPYIAPGGGPGVLSPGDTVIIPVATASEPAGIQPANRHYLSAEEALYGVDIALDPDEIKHGRLEIKIDSARGNHDVELQAGVANVIQGLQIELHTERGETVHVPEVGIRRTPGVKGTLHSMIMASVILRESILSDPRVESIQESAVRLEGDSLIQEITPILVGSRAGPTIQTPFGKAEGKGT